MRASLLEGLLCLALLAADCRLHRKLVGAQVEFFREDIVVGLLYQSGCDPFAQGMGVCGV